MPFSISSDSSGGFWVTNTATGKRKNKRPLTKKQALAYQRALYANVPDVGPGKHFGGTMTNQLKHGGNFSAKDMDHLQAIHDHAHDLGAKHDGEEAPAEKHGNFSAPQKQDKIQAMHDHSTELGADCAAADGMGSKRLKLTPKAMKYMMDMGADQYAQQEAWDVADACQALIQIAMLVQGEIEEPDDLKMLQAIGDQLIEFIKGEWGEVFGAAAQDDEENGETGATIFAQAKALYAKAPAKDGPDSDYLVVDKDGQHLRVKKNGTPDHGLMGGAWAALHGGYRGNKYEGSGKEEALAKLKRLYASEKMDTPGEKGLDLSYIKALGVLIPDSMCAVKFTGRDEITFPTFIWGSPDKLDIEADFFTRPGGAKGTDFFDAVYGKSPRPLTWDHGQDQLFKDPSPVVGKMVDWKDDEIARWATAVLSRDKLYRKYLDGLIEEKALGASSDSAPQYVVREKAGKGNWIKQWPWIATALTPMPAEPRMKDFTPEFLKSWGLALPDASEGARQAQLLQLREKELRIKSLIGRE